MWSSVSFDGTGFNGVWCILWGKRWDLRLEIFVQPPNCYDKSWLFTICFYILHFNSFSLCFSSTFSNGVPVKCDHLTASGLSHRVHCVLRIIRMEHRCVWLLWRLWNLYVRLCRHVEINQCCEINSNMTTRVSVPGLCATFVPCILACKVAQDNGDSCCVACLPGAMIALRTSIRSRYRISVSVLKSSNHWLDQKHIFFHLNNVLR